MRAIRWVIPYVSKYKFRMIFALILNVLVTLLGLVNPYLSGLIVADVLQAGKHELLPVYLGVMLGNSVFRSALRYSFLLIFESTSQLVLFALRRDLYERIHRQTFTFFDENRVGDLMARMTGDLDAIRHFVAYETYAIPEAVLMFTAALVMMFALSAPLAVCMLAIAPVVMFTAYKQSKAIKPAFRNVREQFSHLNSVCEENIGGNRVVKAFAKEAFETEKFTEANESYRNSHIKTAEIWSKFLPIMDTCANALPFFSLLLGSLLIIWGRMELWQLIAFNGYLWMINNPTRMFGWYVNDTQNFITSLDKVYGMMYKRIHITSPGVSGELAEGVHHKENARFVANSPAAQTVAMRMPPTIIHTPPPSEWEGFSVEFSHVDFGYNRNDPNARILKDITFRAEEGWTVGVVGPTGSGKTTLAQLIGRYYDVTGGEVRVGGVNVKDYNLETLRRAIASAMQDVFLFSNTIEGNIAYGKPDMPMETVYSSAEAADADGFVRGMPEGFDTIVGERGVGLSGGQKQRLSLARALAVEPAVLILDDTTSAVDMETERRIQQALRELNEKRPRTTFIIAHRLLSVKAANLILVLENGAITERGTHETLMAQNGYYARLFREQQGLDSGAEGGGEHGA